MSRPLERVIAAEVASPGLARGVIHLPARRREGTERPTGPPARESAALERALGQATRSLEALAGQVDQAAADIVAFQIAMLADPELTAPAFEAIEGGEPAETAFRDALDLQIADYRAEADEYFRARAEDLTDLRDRVIDCLGGRAAEAERPLPDGAIIAARELTPSRFLETDWRRARGVVLEAGSTTSHVAMLARARGVPLLIRLEGGLDALSDGAEVILDAEAGRLILGPAPATRGDYEQRIACRRRQRDEAASRASAPAATADGTPITVLLNVEDPAGLEGVDPAHADGIGLARSEFLFHQGDGLPDEERQYRVYRALLHWAGGLPVTIRTLDAGGDKPIPGLTPEGEANPFLGLRGIRLSLAQPEVFRTQLRALARAAAHGRLKVMVPMVTVPEELARARTMLLEEVAALGKQGVDAALPAFGMMVETPAAALDIARFEADFLSIGTNDLVQYVMAASRDSAPLGDLQDPANPAVLELIERVCRHGAEAGLEVSVCGEMACQARHIPALLARGMRVLSVPPATLAEVKAAVADCRLDGDG